MKSADYLPKLISAVYENDRKKIDMIIPKIIRTLKNENDPNFEKVSKIYADYRSGVVMTRELTPIPVPKDKENSYNLLNVRDWEEFDKDIILNPKLEEVKNDIVESRNYLPEFVELGIEPINKIILYGEPGVGKTVFAELLAYTLKKPLLTIDLSATVSSYLGKTGKNIKEIFEYSRNNNAILFLDEFDAIAKKRDDTSELGELKRIVNVLLKELEEWPSDNIIIAATNHPDILDKAIWRRFDTKIEVEIPNYDQRLKIWGIYLKPKLTNISNRFIKLVADISSGLSPSDIKSISDKSLQKYIVSGKNLEVSVLENTIDYLEMTDKKNKIQVAKELSNRKITQREIAKLLGVSSATVNRYIKRGDEEDE